MKNLTPDRMRLKELGWCRCDRATGPNKSEELWAPPWNGIGFRPQDVSFKRACKLEGLDLERDTLLRKSKSFAPTVMVDGRTITPPGWMWVMGLALGGVEWAIHECDTEGFKTKVRRWLKDNKAQESAVKDCEDKLAQLRKELHLSDDS